MFRSSYMYAELSEFRQVGVVSSIRIEFHRILDFCI